MDMREICRTCLRNLKKPTYLLFEEENLVFKIETIASIQLNRDKDLPSRICSDCFNNINEFLNFRKVILSNESDLNERLETLKKTNYVLKPRSKVEYNEFKSESPNIENNVKSELNFEADNDNNNSDGDMPDSPTELDKSIQRALAAKKIVRCKDCMQIFDSRIKLINHRKTEHTTPGICNICGTVVRADNLRKHVRIHSETPVDCDECGKTFKNSESLRGHKLIHKGLLFTCEICGRTFKMKSEYKRHLKAHTDPDARKVACPLCGKKVHELKKHMQTHTGEKPYLCVHCNKGFSSPYARKIHTRQHTNEKPFICEYCSSGFPQKVSLTSHLKSKHGVSIS